jgi:hypothetical protein
MRVGRILVSRVEVCLVIIIVVGIMQELLPLPLWDAGGMLWVVATLLGEDWHLLLPELLG